MSDVMLFGVLRMTYEMAMADDISRYQYWQRGQQAANEIERLRVGLFDCMQEAANHHRENEARAKLGGSDMAQRKAKAIVARSGVLLHNIKVIANAALEGKSDD